MTVPHAAPRAHGPRRFTRVLAVVVAVVALLLALGWFVLLRFTPLAAAPTLTGSLTRGTLRHSGRDRTFAYYAPSPLPAHAPLMLVFHGSGETGEGFREHTARAFDRVADDHGFVIVYPDGYDGNWNDCRKAASYAARTLDIDDIGFSRALIGHLERELGIDPAHVFAAGYSNGGQMSYRLAAELPGEIHAIAALCAGMPVPDNWDCQRPVRPIPALIMNGTEDPINPHAGGRVTMFGFGDRGDVRSSTDTARDFATLAGLAADPTVERLPGADPSLWVERSTWGAGGDLEVVLVAIHGGGHTVPQAAVRYPRILGPTATFEGPAEIGRFFARQRR